MATSDVDDYARGRIDQETITSLRFEVERLRALATALAEQRDQLKLELTTQRIDAETARNKNLETIDELLTRVHFLGFENDTLKDYKQALEEQLAAELRRQLDSCHERAADLAGHYRQLVQERNEARAECERLRRELDEAREAVGEGWLDEYRTLADAIGRKVAALETHLRGLTRELMTRTKVSEQHPPAPVEGPAKGGDR